MQCLALGVVQRGPRLATMSGLLPPPLIQSRDALESHLNLLSPCQVRIKTAEPLFYFDSLSDKSILFICKLIPSVIDYLFDCLRIFIHSARHPFKLYIEEELQSHPSCLNFLEQVSASRSEASCKVLLFPRCGDLGKFSETLPKIDLIISLGGDGTVLYSAWQFQSTKVPPIFPVYVHGSLGFLTIFDTHSCLEFIQALISSKSDPGLDNRFHHQQIKLNIRMRLRCTIVRQQHVSRLQDCSSSEGSKTTPDLTTSPNSQCQDKANLMKTWDCCSSSFNIEKLPDDFFNESFHVLNEVVIDRGPSPFMSRLELYGDGIHLTTVQADGIVIASPTGSTAYSMSAHGSIVHPSIPSILVSPICPHSLSFRPFQLPDTMVIKVLLPENARSPAWASFDGRHRVELNKGDFILISVSNYPVPTLSFNATREWFQSLSKCFYWNERRQPDY